MEFNLVLNANQDALGLSLRGLKNLLQQRLQGISSDVFCTLFIVLYCHSMDVFYSLLLRVAAAHVLNK